MRASSFRPGREQWGHSGTGIHEFVQDEFDSARDHPCNCGMYFQNCKDDQRCLWFRNRPQAIDSFTEFGRDALVEKRLSSVPRLGTPHWTPTPVFDQGVPHTLRGSPTNSVHRARSSRHQTSFTIDYFRKFSFRSLFNISASTECRLLQLTGSLRGELGPLGQSHDLSVRSIRSFASLSHHSGIERGKANRSCFRNCRSPNRSHATWKQRI